MVVAWLSDLTRNLGHMTDGLKAFGVKRLGREHVALGHRQGGMRQDVGIL